MPSPAVPTARTPSTTGAATEVVQSPPPRASGAGPRTAQNEHPGQRSSRHNMRVRRIGRSFRASPSAPAVPILLLEETARREPPLCANCCTQACNRPRGSLTARRNALLQPAEPVALLLGLARWILAAGHDQPARQTPEHPQLLPVLVAGVGVLALLVLLCSLHVQHLELDQGVSDASLALAAVQLGRREPLV